MSLSLSKFDFTLLSIDNLPTCLAQGCYQSAVGSLPAAQLFELQDFRDGNLQVMFVDPVDDVATLPERN